MVIRKAITMLKVEDPDSGAAEVLAAMSEHYMLEGISGWSLVDGKGKPVECDKPAIRRSLPSIPTSSWMSWWTKRTTCTPSRYCSL